jgi:branched-subunit amino acid permease
LLVLHISTKTKKIFLIISIILLSAGLTLLMLNSHLSIGSFIQSLLPVLNFLWPAIIILIVIALFLKIR